MEYDFRSRIGLLAIALLLVFSATFAMAQGITYGSISGTVEDAQGAMVAGAKVTALSTATNLASTTQSSDIGFFTFRSLPPGTYKVTIESPNFRTVALGGVNVQVARDTGLGAVKMEVAQAGETIEVVEITPLIETSTSQVTASFSSKTTADLPLSGGFDMLALFVPGVSDSGDNSFSNSNGASFSSNGLRGRSNNFQIDGQSNNDNSVAGPSIFIANQDVIGELSVITNQFSVEYGRASGTVVNYITKSGTNDFHGSLFEYYTGSLFDSHTNEEKSPVFGFCTPGQNPDPDGIPGSGDECSPVSPLSRYVDNRFGGTVGGPIWRDKAWFFGSYLGERTRAAGSPSTSSGLTPTPSGLTTLATAFPGNPAVAALNAIGPYAVKAGNPHPFAPGPVTVSDGVTSADVEFGGISRNVPSLFNDREFTGKVDVQLTSKDRVSARYIFQQNILTGATGRFAAGAWVDIPARDQQIALDWVRSFSTSFVNQVRYSFSRAGFGFEGGSFAGCTRASINACPTGISFNSNDINFGMQNNLPQGRTINNSQVQDNASLVRGRHTLKFGGEFYKQRSPNTFLPNINGTYTFNDFDSFLQNASVQLNLTDGPPKYSFKEYDLAAYFGDDWRVKDNLTINLGLRWEYSSQAINVLHDLSVANQAGSNPFWDTSLPAHVTTVPALPNHFKYLGPNVGFAWKPRFLGASGDKTVIRGGFRITYDPSFYNMFLNVATAAPVVNAGSIAGAALPTSGFLGSDVRAAQLGGIPTGGNPGTRNNTRVARDFHEPYTEGWSLGIQQELTNRMVLEVRYVGNHVVGNFQTVNANPALAGLQAHGFSSFIPSGFAPCTTVGAPGLSGGRADCNFRNVRNRDNTAWSRYSGLQSEFRIREWHGLSGAASFTWSKTLDNSSEIFSTGAGGNTVAGAQNPFDISKGEKSLSGLDFPHGASIYMIYDLPFYKNQQGFLGKVLGGYQANTTWRYTSGQVWTPVTFPGGNSSCQNTFDNSFFGYSTCRPFVGSLTAPVDSVGQCTDATLPDCGLVNWFDGTPMTAARWIYNDNTAATFFGTPYGNSRRNPGYRGQPVNTVNFSLFKTTKLTEKLSLRLEAQVYNLFNHMFLGVPDPTIDACNFAARTVPGCGGSFANNFSNSSGGVNAQGAGGYTNATLSGLGRRRMILGVKITF
jgi:hypothetical protein